MSWRSSPTAPAGSCSSPAHRLGQSTTLAAMIDKINKELKGHIITVEDRSSSSTAIRPASSINAKWYRPNSFQAALKYALRQDPTSC